MEVAEHASGQLEGSRFEIRSIADLYLRLRYSQHPPEQRELEQALRHFRPAS